MPTDPARLAAIREELEDNYVDYPPVQRLLDYAADLEAALTHYRLAAVQMHNGLVGHLNAGAYRADLAEDGIRLFDEAEAQYCPNYLHPEDLREIRSYKGRLEQAEAALTHQQSQAREVFMPSDVLQSLVKGDPEKAQLLAAWDHENELRHAAEAALSEARQQHAVAIELAMRLHDCVICGWPVSSDEHHICPCCGFHPGYDEDPTAYQWDGKWWSKRPPPKILTAISRPPREDQEPT